MTSDDRIVHDAVPASSVPRPRGPLVALVASSPVLDRGRAAEVVLGLARVWAGVEPGVVLVDGDLASPALHREAGVEGGDGLGDVLAGRLSLAEASRPVPDTPGLFLVPAGAFPPDPFTCLDEEGWRALAAPLLEEGRLLVCFLPQGEPWVGPVRVASHQNILLVPEADEPSGVPRAVVSPGQGRPSRTEPPEPPGAPPGTRAGPGKPEGSVPPIEPHPMDSGGSSPTRDPAGPTPDVRVPRRPAAALLVAAAALLLLVVGLVRRGPGEAGSGWRTPSSPPMEAPVEAVGPGERAPAASGGETRAARPELSGPAFALRLGSFADPANARARIREVRTREPDVWLTVAPVEVEGRAYHRVLAGLPRDSAAALALGSRLGASLGEDPGRWLAQPASLAFLLLETAMPSEAEARRAELELQGVAGHVLVAPSAEGGSRYRVYAGAYGTPAEAAFLRGRLEALGVESALRPRLGEPPP